MWLSYIQLKKTVTLFVHEHLSNFIFLIHISCTQNGRISALTGGVRGQGTLGRVRTCGS